MTNFHGFRNIVQSAELVASYEHLLSRLHSKGLHWRVVEQQAWEISEYNMLCPDILQHTPLVSTRNECPSFKIFQYPLSNKAKSKMSKLFAHMYEAVAVYPTSNTDAAEACLFIPIVETTCLCNECARDADIKSLFPLLVNVDAHDELQSHEFWKTETPHLIFESSDMPCVAYDIGNAIAAKSGITSFHIRPGFDVPMPHVAFVEYSHHHRHTAPVGRKYLLTFRGPRTEHYEQMRKEIYRIHNGKDIILLTACRSHLGSVFYDNDCVEDERKFEQYTDQELAVSSKFCLILEGFGDNAMRLVDVMSGGCIPVILVDHYVLPFEGLIDWENFSIRVPEHRLEQVCSDDIIIMTCIDLLLIVGALGS